jgi:hypothetical protein
VVQLQPPDDPVAFELPPSALTLFPELDPELLPELDPELLPELDPELLPELSVWLERREKKDGGAGVDRRGRDRPRRDEGAGCCG